MKPQPNRTPGATVVKDLVRKSWLWEVAACAFSLACLVTIIGVLIFENGNHLSQWSLMIPLNAVVSFLATIAKSSFLLAISSIISQIKWLHFQGSAKQLIDLRRYDEASRGPLGSAYLLWYCRKETLLASLAAFITLVALLVDPFVQLVFSFPSQSIVDPSVQATIPMSRTYYPNTNSIVYERSNGMYECHNCALQVMLMVLQIQLQ